MTDAPGIQKGLMYSAGLLLVLLFIGSGIAGAAETPNNTTGAGNLNASAATATVSLTSTVTGNETPSVTVTNNTTPAVTTMQTTLPVITTAPSTGVPPVLLLMQPEVMDMTVLISGIANSGTPNTTISGIQWRWGDGNLAEYHNFPNTHTYTVPGQYSVSVTAVQSDGLTFTRNQTVNVTLPVTGLPGTALPGTQISLPPRQLQPAGAPELTLFSPVIDKLNATLNGYATPGGRELTITVMQVDWGDGTVRNYTELPQTHAFKVSGIYTAKITGIQSDGQNSSKSIAFELNQNGTGTLPPPPADGRGESPWSLYGIIIATVLLLLVAGGIVQRILHRKREREANKLPGPVMEKAEAYHRSKEAGDLAGAADYARACAHILRADAGINPERRVSYLEKAALWDTIARTTDLEAGNAREPGNRKVADRPSLPREDYISICEGTDVNPEVLASVIDIAAELAAEGREGKPVGTSFVIGDTGNVMEQSKQFVLNPFYGHMESERRIIDAALRENIKEFAQLDGAFIISGRGIVEAAGRYITVDTSSVKIPKGMGSRHSSVAGITMITRSIGVVVSESGGRISVMKGGEIVRSL
jgi:PKD repeat protein